MADLTTAQLQTLKADIAADPVLSLVPQNSDGAFEVAAAYNLEASPDFTVWKRQVTIDEVGQNLDSSEVESLTTAENGRMQTFAAYNPSGPMPERQDHRDFFDGVFSGAQGVNTRALLLTLWKRLALRIEELYATGTGSDGSPATMAFEGTINFRDVLNAWSS
jgi:hypothetical protein